MITTRWHEHCFDDHDPTDSPLHHNAFPFISPPSGLIQLSADTPMIHYDPFLHSKYDTFNDDEPGGNTVNRSWRRSKAVGVEEAKTQSNSESESDSQSDHGPYSERGALTEYGADSVLWSGMGRFYRRLCFSEQGLRFNIALNGVMVTINSVLIAYEVAMMVRCRDWTIYYDLRLPLIYSLLDVVLTVVLLLEISLHLTAIYRCHIVNYFRFSNTHKADVVIFVLSLMLCIVVLFDVFPGLSDMDNMAFLVLRIVRDIMRFVRTLIFAKILFDGIVRLNTPKKKRERSRSQSTECSAGWDALRADKQRQFVCL